MLGVVIVTYNSENYIRDCLESVLLDPSSRARGLLRDSSGLTPLKGGTAFKENAVRVFVVDNNSKDETVKIIRDNFPEVELILNDSNLGFAKAINQGIRDCLSNGCEYILVLNPDTKVERGAIEEMTKVMKSDKKVGVVQPLITLMSDPEKINTWGNEYKGFGLVSLGGFRQEVPSAKNPKLPNRQIEFASGACMLIKSPIFKEIGLFDERFFLYFEDTEFSERVRKAGYEIRLAPEARVQHDYHRPYALRKFVWFLSGWGKYLLKNIAVGSKS